MFNLITLRYHRKNNVSIPVLWMPGLLAITAFPGFVEVFNNSHFWLWFNRFRTCNIFIVITKWSYFLMQIPLSHSI